MNGDGNPDACKIAHHWINWHSLPRTSLTSAIPWKDPDGNVVWTGFYGDDRDVNGNFQPTVGPRSYAAGNIGIPPTSIGARVLGQQSGDHFGTAIGTDGNWLYISAPNHTAVTTDVQALTANRTQSGVVYQLRTSARVGGQPNLAQLWVEPGLQWPYVDAEVPGRTDFTMPLPHQYVIQTVGSTRGDYPIDSASFQYPNASGCPGDSLATFINPWGLAWASTSPLGFNVSPAGWVDTYFPYPATSAGYWMGHTPQIVGPHVGAHLGFVRAVGDLNGDGVPDFAVGSGDVQADFADPNHPSGAIVGGVFIVYCRPLGLEGSYLLNQLALPPSDSSRLRGVYLHGTSDQDRLGRVFDAAGDFDGDGIADIVVGSEGADGNRGAVIVILGSPTLDSPSGGWTVDDPDPNKNIVTAGRGILFRGESANDLAGANVAGAGDVDGDGIDDILIAAPGAEGGQGAVYLIYGSPAYVGKDLSLAKIGTLDLPGVKFVGRRVGDLLGGGTKVIAGTDPANPATTITAYSRGVAALGDIDGDGRADYAISAMRANVNGRVDCGEVYILYGRGDPH